MFRSILLSALWFTACVLLLFKYYAPSARHGSGSRGPWCGVPGVIVNALVAETQARQALGEQPFSPTPLTLYSLTMVDGGFIVRLGHALSPGTISLDGVHALMWVDGSTGCVTVLSDRR